MGLEERGQAMSVPLGLRVMGLGAGESPWLLRGSDWRLQSVGSWAVGEWLLAWPVVVEPVVGEGARELALEEEIPGEEHVSWSHSCKDPRG
jgi:hypothetical protein